jgi:2-isopropylmalate synthase
MDIPYARPKAVSVTRREWPGKSVTQSPAWCAVDLRDGNQALPNPMSPDQKKRYFQMLTEIGFKEIEIGFPSASADDFQFCRDLIEQDLIPEGVTISVLTQARAHLIERTMEALKGVKKAVCHVYIATSDLHMHFVFGKTREETMTTALDSVRLIRELVDAMPESDIGLEFSPEEFTDTDLDYAVEICDRVVEAWNPKAGEKVILNLPATVERRLPNEYADMIEEFIRRQKHGEQSVISLHAHNDMGMAVAASQMALMAGATRVEGTLMGHGERCGNVDLVTLALNLEYLGVKTGLDFSHLDQVCDELVELTDMPINPRHPYAGELVFTAFSGSHQDAIHKGLTRRQELTEYFGAWKVPYLHITPEAVGRSFEKFIRINSQSGKGGIAHVLDHDYGVTLPRPFLVELSRQVQMFADQAGREIDAPEVWGIFQERFMNQDAPLHLLKYWPRPQVEDPSQIAGEVHVEYNGEKHVLQGTGSGPIAAFVHAIRTLPLPAFKLEAYSEDAIGSSAEAEAIAYVQLKVGEDRTCFGAGTGGNIDQAAVRAVAAALNGALSADSQG